MPDLLNLTFDNSYARLGPDFGQRVEPTPLTGPKGVAWNADAAALLDIDAAEAWGHRWVDIFSGNAPLPGAEPTAMLYAGHQFGGWVPQLGDGRAILLGEVVSASGRWDLHLKGSGPTRYSRGFDGRAVLRSTIREYLCGEAMHGLGVPTTRSLCIVGSGEPVRRERVETAATLVRLAPSHVRFGSFQLFTARGRHAQLRTLADYVIAQHYPELDGGEDRVVLLLREVAARTARLAARWQAIGWAHGVLNTDNMSVLGVTLDYGPFGFMDRFDPGFVPNTSDHGGRYAFEQQPAICLWNVTRLAEALLPLIDEASAVAALGVYEPAFIDEYGTCMRRKLGLREARDDDGELLDELIGVMAAAGVDHTHFWRTLAGFREDEDAGGVALAALFAGRVRWSAWAERYAARLRAERSVPAQRSAAMNAVNPLYVLRNHLAERVIRQAEDDGEYGGIERLRLLLRDPFTERPDMEAWAAPPPPGSLPTGLSCSS